MQLENVDPINPEFFNWTIFTLRFHSLICHSQTDIQHYFTSLMLPMQSMGCHQSTIDMRTVKTRRGRGGERKWDKLLVTAISPQNIKLLQIQMLLHRSQCCNSRNQPCITIVQITTKKILKGRYTNHDQKPYLALGNQHHRRVDASRLLPVVQINELD